MGQGLRNWMLIFRWVPFGASRFILVWGNPILGAKCGYFGLGEFFGLLRYRGAFEEHGTDLVAEGADAPALNSAHFGVKISLEGLIQRQKLREMGPAQLLRQCRNNPPPVFCAVVLKDFHLDTFTNPLVEERHASIDRACDATTGLPDHIPPRYCRPADEAPLMVEGAGYDDY